MPSEDWNMRHGMDAAPVRACGSRIRQGSGYQGCSVHDRDKTKEPTSCVQRREETSHPRNRQGLHTLQVSDGFVHQRPAHVEPLVRLNQCVHCPTVVVDYRHPHTDTTNKRTRAHLPSMNQTGTYTQVHPGTRLNGSRCSPSH